MFDRRLMRELKIMKAFWMKVTATAIVVVTLTILQGQKLASFIDALIIKKNHIQDLWNTVLLLALIILAKNTSGFIYEYMNRTVAISIKENLRQRVSDSIIKRGPIRLKDEAAGALTGVVQSGIDQLEPYYSEFIPQLVSVMVSTVLVLITVMSVDWISGIIMLVTVPFIPVFMILIGKMATNVNQQQWKKLQQMNGHFLDVLRGLPTLRLFGRIKRQAQIVAEVNEAFRETTMKVLRISFLSALVLELVATISTAMVSVSLGVRLIYGRMDFYSAFFVLLMAPEYYQPIRQLGAKFHAAMGSRAAADSVYEYLDVESQKPQGQYEQAQTGQGQNEQAQEAQEQIELSRYHSQEENMAMRSLLSVRNLSYSYDGYQDAISNVSMELLKGKKTALVGPSGSGKSTIVGILLGFIKDYEGEVRINAGSKKALNDEHLMEYFAYVPQNPKLFKGSLRDNLTLGNESINDAMLRETLEKIGLSQWSMQLTQGLDTYIGEGGINVSGGQTQLIAIGRALLKQSAVFILDEPTSAMDVTTEERINRILDEELKHRTVLVIAHRVPTIQSADVIYYLEQGVILEHGSREEMMNNKGPFYRSLPQIGGGV